MPKKFKVEITLAAESDIASIWEYISQDNIEEATNFIIHLEEQIGTLEQFPERCPNILENRILGTSYRHLLYGKYRTIFKVLASRVIIMRVIHGARLLDTDMLAG
jgi:toxin ParE1/3/4